MLKNLQLMAYACRGKKSVLYRIPIERALQRELHRSWGQQHDGFLNAIEEIDFDAGYTPSEHEKFRINDFSLPEEISGTLDSINTLESISEHPDALARIKTILAIASTSSDERVSRPLLKL